MALYIQHSGSGVTDPAQAFADLTVISDYDATIDLGPVVNNAQKVTMLTYSVTCSLRLFQLAMSNYAPNYTGTPQQIDVYILAVDSSFYLPNGDPITKTCGRTLPPGYSNLAFSSQNPTPHCLVIYDTSQNSGNGYCVARQTSASPLIPSYDLNIPNPVILYHELSHAWHVLQHTIDVYPLSCYNSGPGEEYAAILDENQLRLQINPGDPLREPNDSCCNPGCPYFCCIIASVTSGSPLSTVVQDLRALRDDFLRRTEVGFAFFKSLFYDYYDFSPQICTMIAGQPELRARILSGFVRPLLRMLQTIRAYAIEDLDDSRLGTFFLQQAGDEEDRTATLAALADAERVWRGEEIPPFVDAQRLAELLSERAWGSEHVRWALVEPVHIYHRLLKDIARWTDSATAGRAVRAALVEWAPRIPIDHVWASLPPAELEKEIEILEGLLLKSARTRAAFRDRLRSRFGTIEPIRRLLAAGRATGCPA